MIEYPNINPVMLNLGPIKIYWYGAMYLLGFLGAWILGVIRTRGINSDWQQEELGDLISYCAFGIILGGRIGYMLFYHYPVYGLFEDPLAIFRVWDGGMSFHGGLLGVIIAGWLYAIKTKRSFFAVMDFLVPFVPVGVGLGRIGNFINGELWGRVTDVSWGMVFPHVDNLPRHPSQLYEFFLEGVVLFLIVWFYSAKKREPGRVSGLFLLMYACFRILIEFFRQPDTQLGFILFDLLTMGQLLSLPLLLLGCYLLWRKQKMAQVS